MLEDMYQFCEDYHIVAIGLGVLVLVFLLEYFLKTLIVVGSPNLEKVRG